MMELKDRIIFLRKSLGLTQAEFGNTLGLSRGTVANYEMGYRTPMNSTIQSICNFYKVSSQWLASGEGEMLSNEVVSEFTSLSKRYVLDHDDIQVIKAYLEMAPEQRSSIKFFVKSASGIETKKE